jgi:hypothetical protein
LGASAYGNLFFMISVRFAKLGIVRYLPYVLWLHTVTRPEDVIC